MAELDNTLGDQLSLVNHAYQLGIDYMVSYSFQLLSAVIVVLAGFYISRLISNLIGRVLEAREVDTTLRQFIGSTVRFIILIIFVVIAIQQLGINITPMVAAIGGLTVGLSLALQGPVSNYGAGLIIILTRMYKVGDTISTQGCTGIVEEISLAATEIRAEDGEVIVIPNKHILGEIHSNSETNRIVEGTIGVAYDADIERAIGIIEQLLAAHPDVNKSSTPEVGIAGFGDSSVDLEYRYWAPSGHYYPTTHAVNLGIFNAFKEAGVAIPFPQREVRLLE